jgi:hypothetical protein
METMNTTTERRIGDGRIFEEEARPFIDLKWNDKLREFECPHFPVKDGRYEKVHLRLETPDPILGEQTRSGALCRDCFHVLRAEGVAPRTGLWDSIDTYPASERKRGGILSGST